VVTKNLCVLGGVGLKTCTKMEGERILEYFLSIPNPDEPEDGIIIVGAGMNFTIKGLIAFSLRQPDKEEL
jgi:hypothetical protein